MIKVSMLMPTLNRRELMFKAVKSILSQTYQNFEIIIIDQSDVCNEDICKLDSRIKYFYIREKGLSHARNVGLKYVTGEIVGLMDDDAIYPESVLQKVVSKFSSDKSIGFLSGVVMDPDKEKITLAGMDNKPKKITRLNVFKCCISPSMFLLADFAKKIMFDENLGIGSFWGSAEETDHVLMYIYQGLVGAFDPSIIIYHKGDDKHTISFLKLQSYSRGFGACCCKHYRLFHNKTMLWLYLRSLIRAIVGIVLSCIKLDRHMILYYKKSLFSKMEGYKTYKLQVIVNEEGRHDT